jgi:hypothetical protein
VRIAHDCFSDILRVAMNERQRAMPMMSTSTPFVASKIATVRKPALSAFFRAFCFDGKLNRNVCAIH